MQVNPSNPYAHLNQKAELALHELDNASFEERVAAFVIDTLFIGIVSKIFAALGIPTVITLLFPLIYYALAHLKFGRTLGKQLLGLHVIHEDADQKLKFRSLLVRESFGKFVSSLGFGAGYLAVMFSEERRAWHDKFSKTRVVSYRSHHTSVGTQILRGLGSLAALFVLIIGGFVGIIGFSSYPLKNLQARLMLVGVHMQGLHGSLYSGFRVDRVHWQSGEDSAEIEGVELELSSVTSFFTQDGLQVAKLSVESGYIRSMAKKKKVAASPTPEQSSEQPVEEKESDKQSGFGLPLMLVSEMDIQNLVYETPENKFQLKRLFVENFQSSLGGMKVDRVYVDSSDFIFNIPQVAYSEDGLSMDKHIEAIVKPTVYPILLKSDIDFKAKAQGDIQNPSIDGEAFQKKLVFNRGLAGFSLELQNWSPGHYLRGHWPLTRLNLKVRGQGDLKTSLLSASLDGGLSVYQVPFRLVPGQSPLKALTSGLELRHERGGFQSRLMIFPSRYNSGVWAHFSSNFQLPTQAEELALLIYGRAWGALGDQEREMIVKDLSFFQSPLFKPEALKSLDLRSPASSR